MPNKTVVFGECLFVELIHEKAKSFDLAFSNEAHSKRCMKNEAGLSSHENGNLYSKESVLCFMRAIARASWRRCRRFMP